MGLMDIFKGEKPQDAPQDNLESIGSPSAEAVEITTVESNTSGTVEIGKADPQSQPTTERCPICGMYELPNDGIRLKAFELPQPDHGCMSVGTVDEPTARRLWHEAVDA